MARTRLGRLLPPGSEVSGWNQSAWSLQPERHRVLLQGNLLHQSVQRHLAIHMILSQWGGRNKCHPTLTLLTPFLRLPLHYEGSSSKTRSGQESAAAGNRGRRKMTTSRAGPARTKLEACQKGCKALLPLPKFPSEQTSVQPAKCQGISRTLPALGSATPQAAHRPQPSRVRPRGSAAAPGLGAVTASLLISPA